MTDNPMDQGNGINGMLYHKLESIALQLNTLATKEELKDIKSTISSMVPRTEMDVRWRSSEGSMDEIRKTLDSMREEIRTDKNERAKEFDKFKDEVHTEIDSVKTKLDRIEEGKLPNWLVGALSTIVGSLVVLATVWAVSQAFHVTNPIHVSPLP
jgi:hypothetical protein